MKLPRIRISALMLIVLTTLHVPSQASNWEPINDELFLAPDSVKHQGELRKVTIKLKGEVHDVLVFCKKNALVFNEEMIAASETPAGTSLVKKVCESRKKWYELWK